LLNDFRAEGMVDLTSAMIGGSLVCDGGYFAGKLDSPAMDAWSETFTSSLSAVVRQLDRSGLPRSKDRQLSTVKTSAAS
jgi:hypothetical protein